jgi:hypothetical protein
MNRQKNTEVAMIREVGWVKIVVQSWQQIADSGQTPNMNRLAKMLSGRLGIEPGVAVGLVEGINELIAYAQAESDSTSTALEEERQGVAAALRAVRPVVQARVQQRLDRVDQQQPTQRCEGCGQGMESQGRRPRSWRSTVGELRLRRGYQWCARCHQGRAPAQQKVGLPSSDYTACLEEVASLMATTIPHQMAVETIENLLGIELSKTAVESIVCRRGEPVRQVVDEEAAEMKKFAEDWGQRPRVGPAEGAAIEVAYLEMDGVIVPVREAEERSADSVGGRGGKGRKYQLRGREVKNAVFYQATACAAESDSRHCLLEKSYVSHLGQWTQFALLVWAQMLKLGFDRARLLVVLSDGAEWIRHLCQGLGLPLLLILDLYHVKRRIWELADSLFGEATEAAREWAQQHCQQVEQGQAEQVIQALVLLKRSQRKARQPIESLELYLRNNLDRRDYPSYRAMGLRVGSGAVESANYHVTGARLKLPGMRWSEDGAAQMACLRADLFNGVWQQRTRQFLAAS